MGEGKSGSSTLRWLYLSAYNWVLFGGWVQILYLAIDALRVGGPRSVYAAVEKPLQIWQTAALFEIVGNMEAPAAYLEVLLRNFMFIGGTPGRSICWSLKLMITVCVASIFHLSAGALKIFNSIVGIVRSPVSATLPQISSRLYVTWGILYSYPATRDHWLVTSLIISWGITEVIRYLFFGLKEAFGYTPELLLWIRYSTFFVLYPTGILSEAGLVYVALPYIKVSDLYSLRMPNRLNYAFDYYYASLLALSAYIPGGPYMYTYMIGQRKKALGRVTKQKAQ